MGLGGRCRQLDHPGQPPVELGRIERRQGGLAGRGARRGETAADLRREADRLAAVVAGKVRHLEPVEDGELDGLLRRDREAAGRLVELLDHVDRDEVRAAQLREPATEGEPRPDPADEADVGERAADVGDRRLREPQTPGELAGAEGHGAVLGEDVEDGRRPRHGRGEGLARAAVARLVQSGCRHRPSSLASRLAGVRHLDSGFRVV